VIFSIFRERIAKLKKGIDSSPNMLMKSSFTSRGKRGWEEFFSNLKREEVPPKIVGFVEGENFPSAVLHGCQVAKLPGEELKTSMGSS